MAEFASHAPGTFSWPELSTSDRKAGIAFYGSLFGWEPDDRPVGPGPDDVYSMLLLRGKEVGAAAGQRPDERQMGVPPHWNMYVTVTNADDTVKRATGLGGKVLAPPFDVMDAGRMAVLADPEGAVFCVWQAKQHRGATIVNEHGSVNFNGLVTRDPERAGRFYGAVFGWELLTIPAGLMWALPGYGDHLEERTPGTRERMEQMGAPKGFIDVVAAVEPIGSDDPETPPHWNVTFAVDDVDAVVASARRLGGDVLTGPFDAPWSRTAVIRDPQGASFVASQFVPENKDLEA